MLTDVILEQSEVGFIEMNENACGSFMLHKGTDTVMFKENAPVFLLPIIFNILI